jgi:hypothetical protein
MAGKIRNLLPRNGRYYARITVPASLRPIVGKRELTEPLGADRTVALRPFSSAIHCMQIELDHARDRAASLNPATQTRRRTLSIRQMALAPIAMPRWSTTRRSKAFRAPMIPNPPRSF